MDLVDCYKLALIIFRMSVNVGIGSFSVSKVAGHFRADLEDLNVHLTAICFSMRHLSPNSFHRCEGIDQLANVVSEIWLPSCPPPFSFP